MMINNEKKKSGKRKVFGSVRALYAVLGVAAIAVSLISYSSVTERIKRSAGNTLTAYGEQQTKPPAQTQKAEDKTEGHKAEQTTASGASAVFGNNSETVAVTESIVPQTQPSEQKEPEFDSEKCILPLSRAVSKDYSLGIPVYSNTMKDWRTHNGVDFSGNYGDEVLSISDCTVTAVYQDDLWGGVVETECCGVGIKYCGLSYNEAVAVGDILSAGDVLGTLAAIPAEQKDGSHVHVEMRKDEVLCDPLEILGFAVNDIE